MNLSNITIGQYVPGDSPIHRLDPRTKIMAVILLSVVVFLPRTWPGYALTVAFGVLSVIFSQVPIRMVLGGLRPILLILAITLLFNAFLTPGEALFHIGSWAVTREGLILSLTTSIRLILLIVFATLMTLTTSPIRLTDGLENLLRPFAKVGLPAHELALMMTIALRFIPTLLGEAERIMKAQSARGGDFQAGGITTRARALIPVMVPLFVAAFRRADELATAMEARGYRGGHGRTKMKELTFSRRDIAALLVLGLITGAVVVLRNVTVG